MGLRALIASILLVAPSVSLAAAPPAALNDLVAAEKQALASATGKPPPEAIVSLIGDDTRVHTRGGPYVGRSAALAGLNANPGNKGTGTTWHPLKSGISSDGQHGFTLGYFDISGGADPAIAHRRYLAYWVHGASGWTVAAFKQGLRRPDEKVLDSLPPSFPAVATSSPPDAAAAAKSLKEAEQAFSDRAQVVGLGQAFTELGRDDAVNGGTVGAAAIGALNGEGESGPTSIRWSADDVIVSPSGDLGITFGFLRPNGPVTNDKLTTIPFFTIWMRDGPDKPWRYVAE